MEEIVKLYRVNLKGMKVCTTGANYGVSYVVAKDLTEAYEKVRLFLDHNDIGFRKDRELESIELIAERNPHTDTGHILFL